MKSRVLKYTFRVLILAFAALMPIAMIAQNSEKPAAKATAEDSPSKWDIFVGYSYLSPHGSFTYGERQATYNFQSINYGGIASITRYFNKHVGLQFEGDAHTESQDWPIGSNAASFDSENDFSGGSVGLIYRFPHDNWTPFVHALGGVEVTGGILNNGAENLGPVVTAGGGLDYITPLFNHHIGIRLFQVDYQYIHPNYVNSGNVNAARLSTGIVFNIGSFTPPAPVTLVCSASPASIFPGDPVTVTATAGSLDPKLNVIYSWSGTGVTGNGTTATVATGSLTAGTYTVNCGVKEGKPGKEGLKPWQSANATASFTVKSYEPPTISCAADPSTIKPGETSTVTAMGMSPQNRPLSYSYSATSGSVSGSGATATFNSTGAPIGPAGITCNVSDDKGQTATAGTSVTIVAPYVPPVLRTQALCSLAFDKDVKRPTRVDNEAKACLDEVALSLQKQTDAKLVVVAHADAKEKEKTERAEKAALKNRHVRVENFAAERAINTKDYLVTEKGIDAARISIVTSNEDGQKVEDYLVPAGASFNADVQGTTPVDETAVKAQPRKPLPVRRHHARKAQ